jgi:hypothetical protein
VRRASSALLVIGALVGALATLLLYEGARRVWSYRGFVVVLGVLALRSLVRWLDAQPRPLPGSPFARRSPRWLRRLPWRRRNPVVGGNRHGSDRALHLAQLSAGDAHRTLRPLLREVADARLRSHHGVALDEPGADDHLTASTWALVRPDRQPPHDLRAPGLTPDAIDAVLDELETL